MSAKEIIKKIPDLDRSKMPGVDLKVSDEVFTALLAGGKNTILELIDGLQEIDDGTDFRERFCLHNLAKVVATADQAENRKQFVDAITSRLGGDKPATIQAFLVQTMQWIGLESDLPKIAKLLNAKDSMLFDAVLAALTVQGKAAVPYLRKAQEKADGDRKASIAHAISQAEVRV